MKTDQSSPLRTGIILAWIAASLTSSGEVFHLDTTQIAIHYTRPDANTGSVSTSPDGKSATMTGGNWVSFPINYPITSNTRLSFEITSNQLLQFWAIGFDEDDVTGNDKRLINLGGSRNLDTHDWFASPLPAAERYTDLNQWKKIDIQLSQYLPPLNASWLNLVDRHAPGDASGTTVFRNIRLYEGREPVAPLSFTLADFQTHYTRQDANTGTYLIERDGTSLVLESSVWKSLPLTYSVTNQTILSFDFLSDGITNFWGVGLDENAVTGDTPRIIPFGGTRDLSEHPWMTPLLPPDYLYHPHRGWVRYEFRIAGLMPEIDASWLNLINRPNLDNLDVTSTFRNIRIYNGSEFLDEHIINNTDLRITSPNHSEPGHNSINTISAFKTFNEGTPSLGYADAHYEWNRDCWAFNEALTCKAHFTWSDSGNTYYDSPAIRRRFGPTLVTPRHALVAAHARVPASPATGNLVRYIASDGTFYTRRVIGYRNLQNDLAVVLLDQDLPNDIRVAKVLPDDWEDYLDTDSNVPVLGCDQESKALVRNLYSLAGPWASFSAPEQGSARAEYYETGISGDSTSPSLLLIGEDSVILSCTSWPSWGGPSVFAQKAAINTAIQELNNEFNVTGAYSLEEVDLSEFPRISHN